MAITISFTSPANPPHNITSFQVERSKRPASGSIVLAGDVNNVLKVVTVVFSGPVPANGALAGDQMHIAGLVYRIVTNTSTTITFTTDTDLSTITSFPASFDILNDLAEFGEFDVMGTVTPALPFNANDVHQYTDSTGTIFDFYRIKSIDSGGNLSINSLSAPFRPGQVVTLTVTDRRLTPKDSLRGIIGGSVTFEVEVILGGRRQDPKDNVVYADVFIPSQLAPNGQFMLLASLQMARVGMARYQTTWNIPASIPSLGVAIIPSDDYVVSYKANFIGLVNAAPNSYIQFDSEYFSINLLDGPVHGRFSAYATIDDLRMTFFEVDAYLPEAIKKTDVEARNKVLQYHLETASDKLNEELNIHQVRSNSSDRKEYVTARSVYTLLLAARGQNSSAVSDEFVKQWKERAEYILAQLKREGVAQGIPLGRG